MPQRPKPAGRSAARRNPLTEIEAFNRGRLPALLALKYRKMAASPFGYFRGTNHLFHADWPGGAWLEKMPPVWLNGDLHLENFGTYRGDNRLVYFDVGDFDDGCLGPAGRDLARFLVGLSLAARELGLGRNDARLARLFVAAYRSALSGGKTRWIERRTATGLIGTLLKDLERRTQADLLLKRTVVKKNGRRLRSDTGKALKLPEAERARVIAFLERFARDRADPEFFTVLDVAQRVAGVGALGLPRYVVLIRGNGRSDGAALVDLKSQIGSTLCPLVTQRQRRFASEAERVVEIENRMQAVGPAFLTAVKIGGKSFTLRELQPSADKLDLEAANPGIAQLEEVVWSMGELTAWAQLRAAGRDGSANIDDLIAFAANAAPFQRLVSLARDWARRIERDWGEFRISALAKGAAKMALTARED
jgi:uncharacterized protein (DUF2252 family)